MSTTPAPGQSPHGIQLCKLSSAANVEQTEQPQGCEQEEDHRMSRCQIKSGRSIATPTGPFATTDNSRKEKASTICDTNCTWY